MRNLTRHIALLIAILIVHTYASAQRICASTKERVILHYNTAVDIYKERGSDTYYYVPLHVQISTKNQKPQFSFQEYKNNNNAPSEGAILHCLITWGLTKMQSLKLKQYIQHKFGADAVLAGAVNLEPLNSNIIFSKDKVGKILSQALKSRGSLPTFSNSKMALSFHVPKKHVATIKQAIKNPYQFKNTSIEFRYIVKTFTCNSGISLTKTHTIKVTGQLQNWF